MKKYFVQAGYVTSKTDGDQHYIGVTDLINLYKVPRGECVVNSVDLTEKVRATLEESLIVLRPLYHGNYEGFLDVNKS